MKLFINLILLIPFLSSAQVKTDTTFCPCSSLRTFAFPKQAINKNICGTMVIEIESDTLGIMSNPKVIKGLGYGYDEAALKMVNMDIVNRNKCRIKCGLILQNPKKLIQSITISCPEKDDVDE